MGVDVRDGHVGLSGGLLDRAEVLLPVPFVEDGPDAGFVGGVEAVDRVVQSRRIQDVPLVGRSHPQPHRRREVDQLFQRVRPEFVVVSERIHPGSSLHVASGLARATPRGERGTHRDESDPPLRRLAVGGFARPREIPSGPRVPHVRGVECGPRRFEAAVPEVEGVVRGVRHHVEPCPRQFLGYLRRRPHPRPAGLRGRVHLRVVVVEVVRFEVGEPEVCLPELVEQRPESLVLTDRDSPVEYHVTRGRECESHDTLHHGLR